MRATTGLLVGLSALFLAGCTTAPVRDVGHSFCAARVERPALPLPPLRPGQMEAVTAGGVARDAAETAGIIGALDALEALLAAERQVNRGVDFLLARQSLTDRVLLAVLDVNATLAAIDCEGERGDALRGQLQRAENRRARNLGLASILVGAATAAATGGLSLAGTSSADDIVGIVGGSVEAVIGGALLYGSNSGRLRTRNNLLGEIWRHPEHSNLFPPTVWRYLTRRDAPDKASIAEEIVGEWRASNLFREDDPLFAPEGEFSVDALERRDAMLDLLEARIALMSRDLRVLLEQVVERSTPIGRRQTRGVRVP